MTDFKSRAQQLAYAIQSICRTTETYSGAPGYDLIRQIVRDLSPLATEFSKAVNESGSRDQAEQILDLIDPLLKALSAAATKGEIPVFPYSDTSLDDYWNLHTIFRESKYSDSRL